MTERLLKSLCRMLEAGPVVLASVLGTRGATPRKRGSRMLIGPTQCEFSVGGGEAEARVIAAARALLTSGEIGAELSIDLSGQAGAAGICGGRMQIALRRWDGAADRALAQRLVQTLAGGADVHLPVSIGPPAIAQTVHPDPRLLIVGAGHCGHALHQFAQSLDFDVWVFDARADCFVDARYAGASVLCGSAERLWAALDTPRPIYAVLLNRDYPADVAALRVLLQRPLAFLGLMGSKKRIAAVRAAIESEVRGEPLQLQRLAQANAPVGSAIGAQTPAEIAVSILAQLIQARASR